MKGGQQTSPDSATKLGVNEGGSRIVDESPENDGMWHVRKLRSGRSGKFRSST